MNGNVVKGPYPAGERRRYVDFMTSTGWSVRKVYKHFLREDGKCPDPRTLRRWKAAEIARIYGIPRQVQGQGIMPPPNVVPLIPTAVDPQVVPGQPLDKLALDNLMSLIRLLGSSSAPIEPLDTTPAADSKPV